MTDFEFFTGDRQVDQFTLPLHGGKAQLTCTVLERWEERTSRSLNCGMRRKRTLKKTIGISAIEREELESTISGFFGLKGIAGFKSEIRGKLSREVSLEETHEEEEEFEFEAPKCGRRIVRIYQLVRIYQFYFKDFRSWLFRRGDLFKTIVEAVDRVYDRSIEIENDPDCGCHPKATVGFDGLVNVALGKIAMLVGYKQEKNGIELPSLRILINADSIDEVWFRRIRLSAEAIPSYLLFLANESSPVLNGELVPLSSVEAVQEIQSSEFHKGKYRKRDKGLAFFDSLLWGSIGAVAAALLFNKIMQREEEKTRELDEAVRAAEKTLSEARRSLDRSRISQHSAGSAAAGDEASHEGK